MNRFLITVCAVALCLLPETAWANADIFVSPLKKILDLLTKTVAVVGAIALIGVSAAYGIWGL
ncbi:MAG: hypothetical protein FWF99_06735 [Desulfovibrionaceae bacterium]|nr:hypothetical protein [Desulfovibrionaceae bacterium]